MMIQLAFYISLVFLDDGNIAYILSFLFNHLEEMIYKFLRYCIMDISELLIEQYEEFCLDTVTIYSAKLDKFRIGTIFEMESQLVLFTASLKGLRACLSQENVRILMVANHMPINKINILKYNLALTTQRFLQSFILDKGCLHSIY